MKKLKAVVGAFAFSSLIFTYQNCSKIDVETMKSDGASTAPTATSATSSGSGIPEDVICNPLDSATACSSGNGIIGKLYYLTDEQKSLFGGNLNNAKLDDYIQYGHQVSKRVAMSEVNVPTQNWEQGFWFGDGSAVKDLNGNMLYEYFSLDLNGSINLPSGSYQFATMSDDGMRVKIEDVIAVEDDGIHAPRWKCGNSTVSFNGTSSHKIRVQYFQGPRVQITMQMYYRPANFSGNACDSTGGWVIVPATALKW